MFWTPHLVGCLPLFRLVIFCSFLLLFHLLFFVFLYVTFTFFRIPFCFIHSSLHSFLLVAPGITLWKTNLSPGGIILPVQVKCRTLNFFFLYSSLFMYNCLLFLLCVFRTILDNVIIFASAVKYNLENSRGEGKFIVFIYFFFISLFLPDALVLSFFLMF